MKKSWLLPTTAAILAAAGAYISGALLAKHTGSGDVPGWMSSLCESDDGAVSCDKVLASRWSVFPPPPEGMQDMRGRIPTAFLGLAYFLILAVWYAAIGRSTYAARGWHLVPLVLTAFGVLASSIFVWIMYRTLQTWCPLCTAAHIINLVLLVAAILMWPRATKSTHAPDGTTSTIPSIGLRHPGTRLVATAMFGALSLTSVAYYRASSRQMEHRITKYETVLKEFQQSTAALLSKFLSVDAKDITIRDDDPTRYATEGTSTVVVFSDFECTHCKQFHDQFDGQFYKAFGDDLRLVFKHYPLCKDCNPNVASSLHPNACTAARMAEAARMQGGSDAFWTAHDGLFKAQGSLAKLDAQVMARALGLDPEKFVSDMQSDAVEKRIAEDVAEGRRAGFRGTPAVFLNGRPVDSISRKIPAFWRAAAQAMKREHAAKRSDSQ